MFFVGASGQLLTLILTVCLPFVFLVSSGHQKINLPQNTFHFGTYQNSQEVSSIDFNVIDVEEISIDNKLTRNFEFEDFSFQKVPHEKFCLKWKSVHFNCSGNKAPPTFHLFSC